VFRGTTVAVDAWCAADRHTALSSSAGLARDHTPVLLSLLLHCSQVPLFSLSYHCAGSPTAQVGVWPLERRADFRM